MLDAVEVTLGTCVQHDKLLVLTGPHGIALDRISVEGARFRSKHLHLGRVSVMEAVRAIVHCNLGRMLVALVGADDHAVRVLALVSHFLSLVARGGTRSNHTYHAISAARILATRLGIRRVSTAVVEHD